MTTRDFSLPGRSPVMTSNCAVCTSHPLATTTALSVLKDGGNAVDAAIAASATLCVVEPHMTGIGGDCFAIMGNAEGQLYGLNGSGRSPAKADLQWYLDQGFTSIPETSPHAVTAPGAVNAWTVLHERFGRLEMERLFADAIEYAENGFPVASRVAHDWETLVEKIKINEAASQQLLLNGKAPSSGNRFVFPQLANTLKRIAKEGRSAFYTGEIAQEIASVLKAQGGFMEEEDLANVSADWVDLISTDYHGHVLHEIPPNGQGLAALVLVKLLNYFGLDKKTSESDRWHLKIECARIAYAVRDAYISDPKTMQVTVEEILSDKHIAELARLYDPQQRNADIDLPDPKGSDTVYLSVVDRDGMAVSFINSTFGGFGSGIMTPQSGIILQNRACGFNLKKGSGNAMGPAKRPFHTIIPAMVTKNGKITHSFGVMGGQYQAMGHAHVLSNMLDLGMDPQQALDAPRIFWDNEGVLGLETGISTEIESGLKTLGHPVSRGALYGGGQIIQIDHQRGCLIAGSDPRKDGHAAGF